MVFVRYDSIGDILKPSSDPGVTDYSRYAGTGEITVNSQVIAAAVKPADVYQLDHVTFTLRHNEVKPAQSAEAGCIVFSTSALMLYTSSDDVAVAALSDFTDYCGYLSSVAAFS